MNKRSISMILFFTVMMITVLSGCQTSVLESGGETDVSEMKPNANPAEAEATLTPAPIETTVIIASATATQTTEPTAASTDAPTPATEPTATAEPTATFTPSPEPGILRTYEILTQGSEVRFLIDEELLGSPKTVVGRTNQVAGKIMLDLQNPQLAEVGTIQINARDLATDDGFRNRALRRQILDSARDEYQYITFTATEIDGLSTEAVVIGEAQAFTLTGDLQIRDVVQSVTFEMLVTAVSDTRLNGSGDAAVLRSNFDLRIPSVPGVANVSEEVKLEIDFVAESSGG